MGFIFSFLNIILYSWPIAQKGDMDKAFFNNNVQNDSIPSCIYKLASAYPDYIKGVEGNTIVWHDGTKMPFDDGIKNKNFLDLLDKPDLEDQVCSMSYPMDSVFKIPAKNHDPGRVRYEPFFLKMYGNSAEAVKANLVEITWMPKSVNQKLMVSKINGVAERFKKISEELENYPELTKYLKDVGGTFNWRKISGTNRLSTHSFGTTIDINISFSNYWQWDNKDWKEKGENMDIRYINRIPLKIVEIFEKHGFIWGGKWYHYDSMHFEYRPELLVK